MSSRVCVVFDIDDTLYLERDYVQSGFEAVGRWVSKWMEVEDFAARCWQLFLHGRRGSVFDEVLHEIGGQSNPELVSTFVEIYRTHLPSISLAPDANDAIRAISTLAPIAIVSDGPAASQSQKVEALDLRQFSSVVILTEILGREFRKPDPRSFQYVARHIPASAYFYIADNPKKDFQAPKQLGWVTVRIRRPLGLHFAERSLIAAPDYEMQDCADLSDLIRSHQ